MNTPANMPKKVPASSENTVKPNEQRNVRQSSPRLQTVVKVTTTLNGSYGDVRINGNALPAELVPHVDIEMESDGSGVVWVGLIADRIAVSSSSPRRKR